MSSTQLHGVDAEYNMSCIGDYRNSHLAGPCIWSPMARYIGLDTMPMFNKDKLDEFWVLWKLPNVPTFEKIVLLSTYDKVWVSAKNISRLLAAFKEYINAFPDSNTHIGKYIRDIEDFVSKNDNIKGICWNISDIGDDVWAKWDDETEEYVDYNFETGKDHWELFDDSLDKLEFEEA